MCELCVSSAVYRVPNVCWGEACPSDSSILLNGAYDESPLCRMGGTGCRGCRLGLGVNAWSFGVVPLPGRCEPEAVYVDPCGCNGCPGLFDGAVGGGGIGGRSTAFVVCCRGVWVVVTVGWPLEDLDCVGVRPPLLLLLLLLLLLGSGLVVAAVVVVGVVSPG